MTISAMSKRDSRVIHIKKHIDATNVASSVHFIETNTGNPHACVLRLASIAEANVMYSWFSRGDLSEVKQWAYVAAKLYKMGYRMQEDTAAPVSKMLDLLHPLLSDNEVLLNWFAHYETGYDPGRIKDPTTMDFWAYQAIVALRGEWKTLITRCDEVLALPAGSTEDEKYRIDHKFYRALGHGNLSTMTEVLRELVTPKALAARGNNESGFTRDLISKPAVIYAKIAWRHGYEVKVGSPFTPQEWLPVVSLDFYDDYYKFLK